MSHRNLTIPPCKNIKCDGLYQTQAVQSVHERDIVENKNDLQKHMENDEKIKNKIFATLDRMQGKIQNHETRLAVIVAIASLFGSLLPVIYQKLF